MTSKVRRLGSSVRVFPIWRLARREQRQETGFYRRLNRFSTADEWNVLSQPSTVRRPKREVYEVEAIVGEKKRKVREFPFSVFPLQRTERRTRAKASPSNC